MAARFSTSALLRTLRPNSLLVTPPSSLAIASRRSFQTSPRSLAAGVLSPRKPIGAFRGSLFGFLLGTVIAGSGLYYYIVDEYKISNGLLVEDIYALQASVQRLEGYVQALEDQIKPAKK